MKISFFTRGCIAGLAVFVGTIAGGLLFCFQNTIRVQVCLEAPIDQGIQVYYYNKPTDVFSPKKLIFARTVGVPAVADLLIPARQIYGLRIDFGSAPGDVSVLGGSVGDIPLPPWKYWSFSDDVILKSDVGESGKLKLFSNKEDPNMAVAFRRPILSRRTFNKQRFTLFLTLAVGISMATVITILRQSGNTDLAGWKYCGWNGPVFSGLTVPELGFLLLCAAYYTMWVFQPYNFSPDENTRFLVTRFLFEHGRLPVNEETIDHTIGFGYAHIPTMFCNIAGAFFMKMAALFTSDAVFLLRAARMASVLCVTGTLYWTIRVSKLLFQPPFNWLPVCIVAFLPQFASIAGYVNNDGAALCGSSMILFAWVSAIDKRWTYGNATILAIGIAMCATAYYNSYAWILFSLPMFPLTYHIRNGRAGMFKMGLFIAAVAFCLGSYLFLRHLYLYGDLLGFATIRKFAAEYAAPEFVPGVRQSLRDKGYTLAEMLFKKDWIIWTAYSFIGMFGHMIYQVPKWCYKAYETIFAFGALGVLWKAVDWTRNWRHVSICKLALLFSLIACAAITIGLSIHYSFTWDFQPQGRYCLPALLPIAVLSAKGIEKIIYGVAARKIQGIVVFALCLLLGLVTEAAYLSFRISH